MEQFARVAWYSREYCEGLRRVYVHGARCQFNDGMGGGHLVEHNLIFNFVRETADHGAFNR